MPVDTSNQTGFNDAWDQLVSSFRAVAIDNHTDQGEALEDLKNHITGPTNGQELAAQVAYPVVWTLPTSWNPSYDTVSTDQGVLEIRAVVIGNNTDQQVAFDDARILLGRIVNNIENDPELAGAGDPVASRTWLADFQMDDRVNRSGDQRAQLKFATGLFRITAKRILP